MTDLKSSAKDPSPAHSGKQAANPLFLREEEIRQGIELLFYAYRDFTGEPDEVLTDIGLGRAHHRALHFVGRNPGISVSELLAILRITKQSLNRVLNDLIEQDYVVQRAGTRDRRQRLLSLSDKGTHLERQLFELQRRRIARAYRNAGAEAVDGFKKVMQGIMEPAQRDGEEI
jgi:DNA-binding MarR family transcriptional regulator